MPLTLTRSLLVVLVPGIVGLAPWLLLAVQLWPGLKETYGKYTLPSNAILFAAVVVVGSFFEGLATILEVRWDKQCESKYAVQENWYAYLARAGPEPVGNRYIARMFTTLYFELTMLFATSAFLLGAAVLVWQSNAAHPVLLSLALVALAIGAVFYFRWQAHGTHVVLCEVRRELAKRRQTASGTDESTHSSEEDAV
jgi:hypothetical protein